jgi:hypothetical protein
MAEENVSLENRYLDEITKLHDQFDEQRTKFVEQETHVQMLQSENEKLKSKIVALDVKIHQQEEANKRRVLRERTNTHMPSNSKGNNGNSSPIDSNYLLKGGSTGSLTELDVVNTTLASSQLLQASRPIPVIPAAPHHVVAGYHPKMVAGPTLPAHNSLPAPRFASAPAAVPMSVVATGDKINHHHQQVVAPALHVDNTPMIFASHAEEAARHHETAAADHHHSGEITQQQRAGVRVALSRFL